MRKTHMWAVLSCTEINGRKSEWPVIAFDYRHYAEEWMEVHKDDGTKYKLVEVEVRF